MKEQKLRERVEGDILRKKSKKKNEINEIKEGDQYVLVRIRSCNLAIGIITTNEKS